MSTNPLRRAVLELRTERRSRGGYPPGHALPNVRNTHRMIVDPLGLLLEAYARYGPVFSLRILHLRNVFMLGPEANHFMLVSGADRFRWRDGGFGDLIPLLGDGMLTIDGDFHRQSRGTLQPAREFERALAFYGREYWLQVLRGPGTPWAALTDARRKLDGLIYAEIAQRRRTGERGDDVLSLLLDSDFTDR